MARRFRVTIGGITYQVEVEEVGAAGVPAGAIPLSGPAPAPQAAAPLAPPPAPAAPAAAPAPPPAAAPAFRREPAGDGETVRAPLPGMVVAVRCEPGQEVRPGDVLLVLEAMKMENDITAPVAGKVKEILVEKGSSVALGDAMVVLG